MKTRMTIGALLLCAATIHAAEISGTITSTMVLTDDSWLVGDVTCRVVGGPCIRVGASNITLWLNGFNLTGQADPPLGCAVSNETGIDITGQRRIEIFGPGSVQRHRGHGILLGPGTTRARLKDITLSTNCFTGLQFGGAHDNDIQDIVSVRNGNRGANCGGAGDCGIVRTGGTAMRVCDVAVAAIRTRTTASAPSLKLKPFVRS